MLSWVSLLVSLELPKLNVSILDQVLVQQAAVAACLDCTLQSANTDRLGIDCLL